MIARIGALLLASLLMSLAACAWGGSIAAGIMAGAGWH